MIVVFQRQWDRYNSGERAGFSDVEARRLLQAGIAILVAKPEPTQTVTKTPRTGRKPRRTRKPRT
jgi:hypothetical protein